ncbi:MAG: ferric reductase-like transmembrane domain-containing protein [Lacipirellulaceae bacterium]
MTTARYLKFLAWVNGAVPGAMLVWDAYRGQLGANAVNDALRTTGLVALVCLCLSLCVTPLRRLTGYNELVAMRRPLGLLGFYYACAHLAIYVIGDRELNLASTLAEISSRRFLQIGFVAVALMVPLALTSTDGMIRRLGAKRWKLLHRLAYVVAALGVLHYFLLVKSDVRQPLVFAGVVATLLAARAGWRYADLKHAATRPAATPQAVASPKSKPAIWRGDLRVARVFDETPDVRTLRLVAVEGGELPFRHVAGQFLTLQQEIEGKRVTRCYTIASAPSRSHYCEITVKREAMGLSSRNLHDVVREGDTLRVAAPAGRFTFTGAEADSVVLIAGGVGVTPLMSIARYLTDTCWTGRIDFVFAARESAGVIFRDELEALRQRFSNLHVHLILSDADQDPHWRGDRGRLSKQYLVDRVPELVKRLVYLCGPKPMMDAVTAMLVEAGVPAERVLTEAFVSPRGLDTAPGSVAPVAQFAQPDGATEVAPPATAMVRFAKSRLTATAIDGQTLLELSEQAGAPIPFECRAGVCGQCKVRLKAGTVSMDAEDALAPREKAAGWVLACQSHALEDLVVEA